MLKEEDQSPKKITLQQNKTALEGNQAIRFIMPKYGVEQIIKDGHKDKGKDKAKHLGLS